MHRWRMVVMVALLALAQPVRAQAPIKAQARSAPTPAWNKGILPISSESYWNAVECGKQGGQDPPCVFYDTGLCKNEDFTLALFTPYKMVAYESLARGPAEEAGADAELPAGAADPDHRGRHASSRLEESACRPGAQARRQAGCAGREVGRRRRRAVHL